MSQPYDLRKVLEELKEIPGNYLVSTVISALVVPSNAQLKKDQP